MTLRFSRLLALGSLLLMSAGASAADLASTPALTLEGAKALLQSAVRYAQSHQAPGGAIAVVDASGSLICLERLDGTFANAAPVSIGKARTAALFAKPTRVFEEAVNKGRYTMLAVAEIAPFTPLQGGVPLEIDGHVIGAIGVSGAASAAQDDEIATAAVSEFIAAHQGPARRTP
ncbi:MAG: heme-binding protein [Steroidobacteraceae bacterium]